MTGTRLIFLSERTYAIVSEQDYDRVSRYSFFYNGDNSPYARTTMRINGKRKTIYLHRMIMHAPPGLDVHHKNHNTLDCTRENLELVPPRRNNTMLRATKGAGGFRGVYFRDKWIGEVEHRKNVRAYIWVREDRIYLGAFHKVEDAARAYDLASIQAFGIMAETNFPLTDYLTPWTAPDRVPAYDHMAEIPF